MRPDRTLLETELLVTQFLRGDQSAFEKLVRLWERALFYYVRRLTASESDAWDILQETWLRLFRSIDSLRDPRALPAYLYATARNLAFSKHRPLMRNEVPLGSTEVFTEDTDFLEFENAEQVHAALDRLPLPQREVLTLFFLNDLSIDDIARLLGIPPGTVKSRLHYAKHALRTLLIQGENYAE